MKKATPAAGINKDVGFIDPTPSGCCDDGDDDDLMEQQQQQQQLETAIIAAVQQQQDDDDDKSSDDDNDIIDNLMISEQVSKLLQIHERNDILECLNQLALILENRITRIQNNNHNNVVVQQPQQQQQQQKQQQLKAPPPAETTNNKKKNTTELLQNHNEPVEITIDNTTTVGSIGNIVIQTLKPLLLEEEEEGEDEEQQQQQKGQDEDKDDAPKIMKKTDIYQAGLQVLQYCATNLQPLFHHFPHQDSIDLLCEIMTKYPNNQQIQELCVVTLSNYISRILIINEKQQQLQRRRYLLPAPPPLKSQSQGNSSSSNNNNNGRRRSSFTIPASISFPQQNGNGKQQQQQDDDNMAIIDETYRSKILFTVLQAMNIHKDNFIIWKYGLLLVSNIVKVSSSTSPQPSATSNDDLVVCTSMIETMKLTGGILLLYQALQKKSIKQGGSEVNNNNNNTTTYNHVELKRYSYRALKAILAMIITTTTTTSSNNKNHRNNNDDYVDLIFNDQSQSRSGIDIILDTMRLFVLDVTTQMDGMELVATLAKVSTVCTTGNNNNNNNSNSNGNGNITIKEILLQKGGLDCILTNMKEHYDNVGIQAAGCRAIANIFFVPPSIVEQEETKTTTMTTSTTEGKSNITDGEDVERSSLPPKSREHPLFKMNKSLKQRYGSSCIKPLLRAMRMYPTSIPVQVHATAALQFIASPFHAMSISEAGGISSIVVALQQHPNVPKIHEHGWGALCSILNNNNNNENTTAVGNSATASSNNQQRMDDLFTFFNENGLVTLMESLGRYPKLVRIQMHGLGCLSCASTRAAKKQEEIISRKGLNIALDAMRVHGCNSKSQYTSEMISWYGCHVIRNVTVTRDFQKAVVIKMGIKTIVRVMERHPTSANVQLEGAKCIRNLCLDHGNLHYVAKDGGIHMLLLTSMREHVDNKLINAFACDALGHLACVRQNQLLILAKNGLPIIVNSMKKHPYHKGIQEQGCIFLVRMSKNHNALIWMKNNDVNPILVSADELLPPNSRAKPLIKRLTKQLAN